MKKKQFWEQFHDRSFIEKKFVEYGVFKKAVNLKQYGDKYSGKRLIPSLVILEGRWLLKHDETRVSGNYYSVPQKSEI